MSALQRTEGNVTLSHCGKGWVTQPALSPAKHKLKVKNREESFLLGISGQIIIHHEIFLHFFFFFFSPASNTSH